MKRNDQNIAKAILASIGGAKNIANISHCSTRLRITPVDKDKVDEAGIEQIDGVKGQFYSGNQLQIILGTGLVGRIYDIINPEEKEGSTDQYAGMSLPKKLSRILGDIFIPVIPALVATGLFSGIINCLTAFHVQMSPAVLTIATVLMKTAFTFLPVLIAWSGMKQFGGSPVLGLILGLMLVNPLLPNPNDVIKGTVKALTINILGIHVNIVSYAGSVLPALVVVLVAAMIEKRLKKVVPDSLDLIITPFVTLLISGLLGILIIGPVCQQVEQGILFVAKAVINLPFGLGGLIIGGTQQAIVVTGMHHIFLALESSLLATTGYNPFNAMITGGIIAQATAAFVTGLKVKDPKKRSLYTSSSLPAFLGITEPAIFGVNLRFGLPFIFALCGGAASGMLAGLLHAASTGMGVAALPGLVTYLYSKQAILNYVLIHVTAMLVSGGLVYFFFDPNKEIKDEPEQKTSQPHNYAIVSPVNGSFKSNDQIKDQTFAKEILGQTVGIEPKDGKIYAPISGKVVMLAPTKHAIGIKDDKTGIEVLLHLGIDTVEMKGRPFKAAVNVGDTVFKGQLLLEMNIESIKQANYDPIVLLVITKNTGKKFEVKKQSSIIHARQDLLYLN
ncbi:PTS beta-glucoside transporter subunit IIBCA [Lactobacillus helsingborgensis]|uniref:PTS beta-glucoside transporter subunit IIBCA n=1 Tax=Lactobacillus helsingborgensis TaxID=1218494 RepID=UPI00164F410C|nr:PTS transporter subunit IIBCA [Lactobacillus helsingborgensis]MBC6356752.1 PTS beta-glucoside transporter subunit IIBCA [Lactobacillus helsingborgensis]